MFRKIEDFKISDYDDIVWISAMLPFLRYPSLTKELFARGNAIITSIIPQEQQPLAQGLGFGIFVLLAAWPYASIIEEALSFPDMNDVELTEYMSPV